MTLQDCYAVILSVADALIYEGNIVAGRQLRSTVADIKNEIEKLQKKIPYPLAVPTESEYHTAQYIGKLTAIKAIKDRLGLGLLEAKQAIEFHCPRFWNSHQQHWEDNPKYKIDPR